MRNTTPRESIEKTSSCSGETRRLTTNLRTEERRAHLIPRLGAIECVVVCAMAVALLHVVGHAAERQEVRRSYELRPGATVSLENVSGDITISSWAESRVGIVAEKIGPSDQLADVEISIDAQPSRLEISTHFPRRRNNRVSVNYHLTIPKNVNLDTIKSVSGDITISDIHGWVVARSVSGSVTATQVSQNVDLSTVSGKAKASSVGGRASLQSVSGDVDASGVAGDLHAKSVSGDILVRGVQGYLDVETVSGVIKITESTPSGIRASTTSGDIRFDGTLLAEVRYELKTHSGRIIVMLPSDSSFALDASTFSGSIDTDFPITLQGRIGKRKIAGVVGDGGPTIELRTFSGSIRLRKSGPK